MKNFTLTLILLTVVSVASAQSNWNIGLATGCVTNISKFDHGDEVANALFDNFPVQSHNFAVNFRYKISDKFSFQTGMSFAEVGFTYAIAKDYSLKEPFKCDDDDISSTTYMSNFPAMIIMNTPLNCSKFRFIFGAGVAIRGVDNNWESISTGEVPTYENASAQQTYITAQSGTTTTISPAATWLIGLERVCTKGNSFSFTFQGNQGFNKVSESTVSYNIGGKEYTHSFINRGSFVSFSLAYNFMPFGTRKAQNALPKM